MNHVAPEKVADVNHTDKNGTADLDIEVSILYCHLDRLLLYECFVQFQAV